MTTKYVHRCLIVPADLAPQARQLCEEMAGPAGAGMFQTALSPTGTEPATHYISSGMIEDVFAEMLNSAQALFGAAQGEVPLSVFEELLNRSDASQEAPYEAMGRLGLQLIRQGEE